MKTHEFEDESAWREETLQVEEVDVDREDDPMLFDEYKGQPVLQFGTEGGLPWLGLDTVTKLRDTLTEWIVKHDEHNDPRI